MPRNTLIFLVFLGFLAVLLGYNYFFQPFKPLVEQVSEQFSPEPSPVDSKTPLEKEISTLTDEEKIGLLLAVPVVIDDELLSILDAQVQNGQSGSLSQTATSSSQLDFLATTVSGTQATSSARTSLESVIELRPGFVTLFGDRISSQSARKVVQELKSSITSPTVRVAVDHEGGRVQRLSGEGFTFLPSWQQLCAFSNEKQDELISVSAQEVRAAGIDIVFGPALEFGSNAVLTNRVCSTESTEVVARAQAAIELYRAAGVLPVVKHFPGIGKTQVDLHTSYEAVEVTPEDAEVYRMVLDLYPDIGVMMSHVGVTNQYEHVPCSLSTSCVGQVGANYPEALIVTDALEMASAGYRFDPQTQTLGEPKGLLERSIEAIEAGNHVLLYGPSVTPETLSQVKAGMVERYRSNQTFVQAVDAAVEHVLASSGSYEDTSN